MSTEEAQEVIETQDGQELPEAEGEQALKDKAEGKPEEQQEIPGDAEGTGPLAKIVLKVNGQDMEVDQDKLVELAQKGMSADNKFYEADQIKKDMLAIKEKLKNDPLGLAQKEGVDVAEYLAKYINDKYEYEQMSPEQKELKKLREDQKKWQVYEQKEAEAKKEQEINGLIESYSNEITEVIKTHDELPKDPMVARRMATHMNTAVRRNLELKAMLEAGQIDRRQFDDNLIRMTAEDAYALTIEDFQNEYNSVGKGLTLEQAKKLLGEETINKWIKESTKPIESPTPLTDKKEAPKKKDRKYRSLTEARQAMQEAFGEDFSAVGIDK